MISFEHPDLLYALPSLAVPVLVHLFNFRRYRQVAFSNVQFLRQIREQEASRTHLKERLILAARLLTLLLLILAFAKPQTGKGRNKLNSGIHVVSIFIDNSYSMQALNREGSLLDEAKRRAKEIVAGYGPNDRFQLLSHNFYGWQQRLLTAAEFDAAVDTLSFSVRSRTLPQILNRQQAVLGLSPQAVKMSYIISDFQQNLTTGKQLKADSLLINYVRIEAAELPNVAVDSVSLLNPAHRAGAAEKLLVKLHNYAGRNAVTVPLTLTINGVQKALGSRTVKANATITDTLSFSGLQAGWQQAELQVQDNPVTFDNRFYFSFEVRKQLPLILLSGDVPDKYLQAAFNTDAFFKPVQGTINAIDYSALRRYPVVMISNVKTIASGAAQQLRSYVANGGTLLIFPPDDADLNSYKALLQPLGSVWPQKLIASQEKVSALHLQSPVFNGIFDGMPHNPDLPVVTKYYDLAGNTDRPAGHLMELPGHQPFFYGTNSGHGMVYISAVPLDERYSNLPHHALLLPMLFRIALLAVHDAPLYYTLGNDEHMSLPPVRLNGGQQLRLTKGKQSFIPDVENIGYAPRLYLADQVTQPGLYRLSISDSLLTITAFNSNRSESDLHYLTDAALLKLSPGQSHVFKPGPQPVQTAGLWVNRGLQLWKVCLILTLVFIAAEVVLIRRFKFATPVQNQTKGNV